MYKRQRKGEAYIGSIHLPVAIGVINRSGKGWVLYGKDKQEYPTLNLAKCAARLEFANAR